MKLDASFGMVKVEDLKTAVKEACFDALRHFADGGAQQMNSNERIAAQKGALFVVDALEAMIEQAELDAEEEKMAQEAKEAEAKRIALEEARKADEIEERAAIKAGEMVQDAMNRMRENHGKEA